MQSKKKKIVKTIFDIYKINGALVQTERSNKSLPFKLVWAMLDIRDVLKVHVTRYEASRTEIYKKFGTTTNNTEFTFSAEVAQDVEKAVKELNETEIEIEIVPLTLSQIEAVPDMQFASGAFEVLKNDIIEFPKPEETPKPKVKK